MKKAMFGVLIGLLMVVSAWGIVYDNRIQISDTKTIANVTLGTTIEATYLLPKGTNRFSAKCRTLVDVYIADATGETSTKYETILAGNDYYEEGLYLQVGKILFFRTASPVVTIEVDSWRYGLLNP